MRYAEFYRKFQADSEDLGADELVPDGESLDPFRSMTDADIIKAIVMGAGPKRFGAEAERRGLLDMIPGNDWN
jgi:hypothetical protein